MSTQRIWFRVARSEGKKLVRGAANSAGDSGLQASSNRWFDQMLWRAMATKWPASPPPRVAVAMAARSCLRSGRVCQIAQHVMQHAAVLEILDLLGGIDATGEDDLLAGAVA